MRTKIVVVSDTHGNRDTLQRVLNHCYPFEIIVHCGDGISDICASDIPGDCTILKVSGNSDIYSNCDADIILTETIHGKTVMVTHGHLFNVKGGYSCLIDEAKKHDAEIVLFGHTHINSIQRGTPILFNPGSLSGGSYGIIDISEKEWTFEHRKIRKK